MAIDVTVCNTRATFKKKKTFAGAAGSKAPQREHLTIQTSKQQATMVIRREDEKRMKYHRLSREESAVIVPGVVTTFGTLGGFFKKLINKTAKEALQRPWTPTFAPTGCRTLSALL
eukprot:TRINITY_DN12116_c0_g1_i4.p4 TRINITY_DN12116_c0_g1~~TRINITY_DN12116_c0_g1_i4.p4  ORF type:complete len:116 (+),score=15.28 TRINITY_DN12116_c0_g1_i4:2106-2453(+)